MHGLTQKAIQSCGNEIQCILPPFITLDLIFAKNIEQKWNVHYPTSVKLKSTNVGQSHLFRTCNSPTPFS